MMIRGHLKVITLKALDAESLSGYSLMKRIEEQIGSKPSPGSVYPLLDQMKKAGYVTLKASGKRKLYSLTAEGREYLLGLSRKMQDFVRTIDEGIKVFEAICDVDGHGMEHLALNRKLIDELKQGRMPFAGIEDEISSIEENILKICLAKDKAKLKKLRGILSDMGREIGRLSD